MLADNLIERRRRVIWQVVATVQLLVLLALGAGLALWLEPQPQSDWLYYWNAAGSLDAYERGGLDLWLLSIPKALGADAAVSALVLNLPSVVWLWLLVYRIDAGRWRAMAQLVVAYLILITPFFGIVQLDLVAAAQMATAFWLLLDPHLRLGMRWRHGLAIVATMFAVSTRPQYALTLWALLAMATVAWFVLRRQTGRLLSQVMAMLLLGSVLGFAVDMGLRKSSGRTEQIRTSSAVTLYAGLLESPESGRGECGRWSVEAAMAAQADMRKLLAVAIRDRLVSQPFSHWLAVLRCKVPTIVSPEPFALYWFVESPNIRGRIDASRDRERLNSLDNRIRQWEKRLYRLLCAVILLTCVWTSGDLWRKRHDALSLLPMLWFGSFWAVHAVFEIQGRYFLGMFLVAPFIFALLCRLRDDAGEGAKSRIAMMPATAEHQ